MNTPKATAPSFDFTGASIAIRAIGHSRQVWPDGSYIMAHTSWRTHPYVCGCWMVGVKFSGVVTHATSKPNNCTACGIGVKEIDHVSAEQQSEKQWISSQCRRPNANVCN